jgi:hypothetical protein
VKKTAKRAGRPLTVGRAGSQARRKTRP